MSLLKVDNIWQKCKRCIHFKFSELLFAQIAESAHVISPDTIDFVGFIIFIAPLLLAGASTANKYCDGDDDDFQSSGFDHNNSGGISERTGA